MFESVFHFKRLPSAIEQTTHSTAVHCTTKTSSNINGNYMIIILLIRGWCNFACQRSVVFIFPYQYIWGANLHLFISLFLPWCLLSLEVFFLQLNVFIIFTPAVVLRAHWGRSDTTQTAAAHSAAGEVMCIKVSDSWKLLNISVQEGSLRNVSISSSKLR